MGYPKAINILHGIGNITLAHAPCIHGKDLILDPAHIPCTLWDHLRFKRGIPVTGYLYRDISVSRFQSLTVVSIAAVFSTFRTMVIGFVPQVGIHLSLQHRFKHGAKDIFDRILHVLYIFTVVLLQDRLCYCNSPGVSFLFSCHKCCAHNPFIPFVLEYRTLYKK